MSIPFKGRTKYLLSVERALMERQSDQVRQAITTEPLFSSSSHAV